MKAPELDVRYVARLARIALSDAEVAQYRTQLAHILEHVAELDRLDVSGIEPTAHAHPVHNVTRPDVARPGFSPEEALANAPAQTGGQFAVVRVVE